MKTYNLLDLLIENKPQQFTILEELLAVFSQSQFITHAFIRGSIAQNSFDRVSDLDLVLSVEDGHFEQVLQSLDHLLSQHFNVLFPGWFDAIVPDFGGLGFVYLIEREGTIYQADLYLLPASKVHDIPIRSKAKLLFKNQNYPTDASNNYETAPSCIERYRKGRADIKKIFIESLVLSFLIKKRLKRGQVFLNYSETFMLHTTIRQLLRCIFDPGHVEYGWYHFEENMLKTCEGRALLEKLRASIFQNPIHSESSLRNSLRFVLEVIAEFSPGILADIMVGVRFFYDYLGVETDVLQNLTKENV